MVGEISSMEEYVAIGDLGRGAMRVRDADNGERVFGVSRGAGEDERRARVTKQGRQERRGGAQAARGVAISLFAMRENNSKNAKEQLVGPSFGEVLRCSYQMSGS